MKYDIVAIGELLVDFSCDRVNAGGYPSITAHPGGAPANYLSAATRYGCRTAIITKVGADAFGRLLTDTLRRQKIDTQAVITDEQFFTTLAFVTLDEDGEREFSFARKPGADSMLRAEELCDPVIDEARVLHFGTLSLTDEPSRSATQKAVNYARERGKLISFDPNLRKSLWRSEDDAAKQILWGLDQADVVKISDEEVAFLWGLNPEQGAEKILRDYAVQLVFVTCGKAGCVFANRNVLGRTAAPIVRAVDTTGAGDIFGGSAMAYLLKRGLPAAELGMKELLEITQFACVAASLSTETMGGIESIPEESAVQLVVEQCRRTQGQER